MKPGGPSRGAGVLFLIGAAVFCLRRLSGFDVFWHLRAGNEMLARHALLWADPFSYTSAQPWINHEWLAQIFIALGYRAGGFPGLVVLQALMIVLALALVVRQCWPGPGLDHWPGWLGLACATVTLGLSAEPRAQLFSWVLFAATLCLCLADWRQPSWRLLWAVPMGVLWANLHGGNPTGVALLVVLFLSRPSLRRALAFVGAALATLASPYGMHVHEHFLGAHASLPEIYEWHALSKALALGSIPQWTAVLSALAAVLLLVVRHRRGEPVRFELLALLLFSAVAARYARFTWELSLVCAASLLRAPATRVSAHVPRFIGVTAGLAFLAIASTVASRPMGLGIDGNRIPVGAARFLAAQAPCGPMLNSYNFGGYLMWAYPREPVFIDSRAFMVYSEAHFRDLLRLYEQPVFFRELEQRWHFRLAVLQLAGRGAEFLAWLRTQPDWRVSYEDQVAAVLTKK